MGLMQRDEDYANYQDLEAHYQSRPSAWIEPKSDWGPGHLQLVQIPSPEEIHDNIVSYWVPEAVPAPGEAMNFDYRIRWASATRVESPDGKVLMTRTAKGKPKPRACLCSNSRAESWKTRLSGRGPRTPTSGSARAVSCWKNASTKTTSPVRGDGL